LTGIQPLVRPTACHWGHSVTCWQCSLTGRLLIVNFTNMKGFNMQPTFFDLLCACVLGAVLGAMMAYGVLA
jgi:hypothetical protein